MDETITVRLSAEQRTQIVKQAHKADEDISEYILKAAEERISRELQQQRADELGLGSELDDIADAVTPAVTGATEIDTTQELYYSVALWDLISAEFSAGRRAAAMEAAPEKMREQVENIRNKENEQ